MADSTVSSLTASSALSGGELYYADNGSTDTKVTSSQIKTFANTSATITLTAGTSTVDPLTFASGTNLGSPAIGAVEYDGNLLYATVQSSNRGYVPSVYICRQSGARTMSSSTSAQAIFNASANGTITVTTGSYLFESLYYISGMSATSGNSMFTMGGTAATTSILMASYGIDGTAATAATVTGSMAITSSSPASQLSAGTGTGQQTMQRGSFSVVTAGTLIPQITLVTGVTPAPTLASGSFFKIETVGITTGAPIGNWS